MKSFYQFKDKRFLMHTHTVCVVCVYVCVCVFVCVLLKCIQGIHYKSVMGFVRANVVQSFTL